VTDARPYLQHPTVSFTGAGAANGSDCEPDLARERCHGLALYEPGAGYGRPRGQQPPGPKPRIRVRLVYLPFDLHIYRWGGRPGTATPPRPAGLSTLTPNSFLLAGLGLPHLERLDDLAAADKIGSAYVPFQPILPGHD
jgi:hypothetical protein